MMGQPNNPCACSPIERVLSTPAQFNINRIKPTATVKKRMFTKNRIEDEVLGNKSSQTYRMMNHKSIEPATEIDRGIQIFTMVIDKRHTSPHNKAMNTIKMSVKPIKLLIDDFNFSFCL